LDSKSGSRIQRDRRNITDADIARRIELLDEVNPIGTNQHTKEEGSVEPASKEPERSAETTAKKAGTSATNFIFYIFGIF